MKRVALLIFASSLLPSAASALGFGDLISAGVNVVGRVGGAAIDKMTDDSPEEREKKRLKEKTDREATFRAESAKIEARTNLSPLNKEKLTRQLSKEFLAADAMSNFAEQQEMRRREQRDSVFTAGGLAGVVGQAALNTPSAVIARADANVAAGIPQRQSRDVLSQVDNNGRATGSPSSASSFPVATTNGEAAGALQKQIDQQYVDINHAVETAKQNQPVVDQPAGMVAQDKGRKIFVEFVGGQKLSERLRKAFANAGYTLADSPVDADVVYQFDGEYSVRPENGRNGVLESVGAYCDNPVTIAPPTAPAGAEIKNAVGGFMAALAGIPRAPTANTTGGFKQSVLVVANRRIDGKDTRVSALISRESAALEPVAVIEDAVLELMRVVGVGNA